MLHLDPNRKLGNLRFLLKALNSLSQDPLSNHRNYPSAEITIDGANTISVQSESHGLNLDQENINPSKPFIDAQSNIHDMVTGVPEGNFLGKKKKRSTSYSIRTGKQQSDIEIQQLAQTVAQLERQDNANYCLSPKMPKTLTASLPIFDGKTEKIELFADVFNTSLKMYPHPTEKEKVD